MAGIITIILRGPLNPNTLVSCEGVQVHTHVASGGKSLYSGHPWGEDQVTVRDNEVYFMWINMWCHAISMEWSVYDTWLPEVTTKWGCSEDLYSNSYLGVPNYFILIRTMYTIYMQELYCTYIVYKCQLFSDGGAIESGIPPAGIYTIIIHSEWRPQEVRSIREWHMYI